MNADADSVNCTEPQAESLRLHSLGIQFTEEDFLEIFDTLRAAEWESGYFPCSASLAQYNQ